MTIRRPAWMGRSSANDFQKYLNEAEVDALLEAARRRPGADGIRLLALMEILYATGLRVTELVTLPLSSFLRESPF